MTCKRCKGKQVVLNTDATKRNCEPVKDKNLPLVLGPISSIGISANVNHLNIQSQPNIS